MLAHTIFGVVFFFVSRLCCLHLLSFLLLFIIFDPIVDCRQLIIWFWRVVYFLFPFLLELLVKLYPFILCAFFPFFCGSA